MYFDSKTYSNVRVLTRDIITITRSTFEFGTRLVLLIPTTKFKSKCCKIKLMLKIKQLLLRTIIIMKQNKNLNYSNAKSIIIKKKTIVFFLQTTIVMCILILRVNIIMDWKRFHISRPSFVTG